MIGARPGSGPGTGSGVQAHADAHPATPVGAVAPRGRAAEPARAGGRPRAAKSRPGRVPYVVHFVLSFVWLALVVAGSPYYRLAPEARLHHPWHPLLKPNGTIGLTYAYAGTALLSLLLLYSVRKRWRPLARLGALSRWLAVHITCGLLGPGFVTLHAGFKIQGLIAVGYWSMICVMLSGFVGYYIYRQIPRALAGHLNESELLQAEIHGLDHELAERYGLGPEDLEVLRRASGAERATRLGPLGALFFLVGQDLSLGLGLRRLRQPGRRRVGRREARRLRALVRQRVIVERRRAFLRQTESLFGYWHTIHKPFAILQYLMIGVHIGVAIWLGYAWAW